MKEEKAKILIIEDESSMREVLKMLLESEGYGVHVAADGGEGLSMLEFDIFDLIITDIKMPGATGFEILKRAQELSPETLVIMITAFGTVESAIEAMKLGAYDYINKPFKIDEIRLIIRNAIDRRRLKAEVSALRQTIKSVYEIENIIGKSPKMQEIFRLIPKVAVNNSNVLITGESGTGKEVIAKALHNHSPRRDKNFVAINCASLPEGLLESELFGHMKGSFTGAFQNKQGLFEIADMGTLFMDEIAEMPLNLQSKVLRAIEDGNFRRVGGTSDIQVNTRVISATNKDLKEAVAGGAFREDLFYRLNVVPIHLPPLRERKEDIIPLAEHFMKKYSDRPRQFSGSAMNIMMNYPWKGNVRELENFIERVVLFSESDIITDVEMPDEIRSFKAGSQFPEIGEGFDLEKFLADLEQRYLLDALRITKGKKTEAAALLSMSFRSFRHKLSKYDIK